MHLRFFFCLIKKTWNIKPHFFFFLSVWQLPLSSCLLLSPPAQAEDILLKFLLRPVHYKMSYRLRNRIYGGLIFVEDLGLLKGYLEIFCGLYTKNRCYILQKIVIVTSYLTMGWENECALYYCKL